MYCDVRLIRYRFGWTLYFIMKWSFVILPIDYVLDWPFGIPSICVPVVGVWRYAMSGIPTGSAQVVLWKGRLCTGWQRQYHRIDALLFPGVEIRSPLWKPKLKHRTIVYPPPVCPNLDTTYVFHYKLTVSLVNSRSPNPLTVTVNLHNCNSKEVPRFYFLNLIIKLQRINV